MDAMFQYDWPGNVRELENEIQRYLATNSFAFMDGSHPEVPDENPDTENLPRAIEKLEKRYIRRALKKAGAHRGRCAKILGISRRTLYKNMKDYGLNESPDG